MSLPLYIIWQDSFMPDEPIIDEQHHGVLASINSLHYFLQQGHGLDALMPTIKICLNYMMFHAMTEQEILKATAYPDIDTYIENSNKAIIEFKMICRDAINNKDPDLVLLFLKNWWQSHLALHEKIESSHRLNI